MEMETADAVAFCPVLEIEDLLQIFSSWFSYLSLYFDTAVRLCWQNNDLSAFPSDTESLYLSLPWDYGYAERSMSYQ